MTRKQAIKILKWIAEIYDNKNTVYENQALTMAIEAIEEKQAGGWISVKDALPEVYVAVMVYCPDTKMTRKIEIDYFRKAALVGRMETRAGHPLAAPAGTAERGIPMKPSVCPFDITYCTNADCRNTACERHPRVFEALKGDFARTGHPISVSDFSGVCRDYIRSLVEEED